MKIISLLVILIMFVTFVTFPYPDIYQPEQNQPYLNWAILGLSKHMFCLLNNFFLVHLRKFKILVGVAIFSSVSAVGGVSAPADISVSGVSTVSGVPAIVGVLAVIGIQAVVRMPESSSQLDQHCIILAFTSTEKQSAICHLRIG
jgi:hypothetical protein